MAGADARQRAGDRRVRGGARPAFQIVDDILDVEGASADLGKTAGKDAAAGKPTYPALFGLDGVAPPGRASASIARAAALAAAGTRRPACRRSRLGHRPHPVETNPTARAASTRCSSSADSRRRASGRARSSSPARSASTAGRVDEGRHARRASTPTSRCRRPIIPYVGRGGLKLAHALRRLRHRPVEGRIALDIGASTGGFTDVLLQRGAARVVALDVGHGQLDWRLRTDPRVIVLERINARTLTPDALPPEAPHASTSSRSTCRSSRCGRFCRSCRRSCAPGGDVVALVKPQFEAGRDEVGKGGIVRDDEVHARVVDEVTAAALALGLTRAGLSESPITGMEGNREFLLHLTRPDA